ncbi:MAG TPA: hypothetical protein VLL98_02210 [Rickettsiales bacterium]|nr:hypothetical protein [Rickettsiales bacterium]
MIQNLKGYSGCILEKYEKNGNNFVRKISRDFNYNRRLKKQCLKQLNFKGNDYILTPKISNYGILNNLFYFDMEYINAPLFYDVLFSMQDDEIEFYINILLKNLSINKIKKNTQQNFIFNKKINSMQNEFDSRNLNNDLFNFSIEKLKNFDWTRIPNSDCHGDLTLQNILLKDDNIYVIDLLDSFYNSWMFDVSRILQDLELGWSYRFKELNQKQKDKILFAKNILIKNISNINFSSENSLMLESIYYVLLNDITRIYSYAKDELTINFLNNALEKLINILSTKKFLNHD